MKLLDWIIIVFLFFCLATALTIYYQKTAHECMSNPLSYGAKQYTKELGYNFEGMGWIVTETANTYQFYFNSTGIYNSIP